MTDPLRLADEPDSDLSLLVRAGQREEPPRHALQKTLAGLGIATTVIGATQAAGAAVTVSKLGVLTLAKWAGAGVVSGVIAIGGVELVQQGIASSRPEGAAQTAAVVPTPNVARPIAGNKRAEPPSLVQAPSRASQPATIGQPQSLPAPDRAAPAVDGERAKVSGAKPRGQLGPSSIRPPDSEDSEVDSTISVELALIDEARRALQTGRTGAALGALQRHRAEVKRPRLGPEAQYLEMEALFASGNASAAQAVARALVARYPGGPHAARAHTILGEPESR